MKLASHSKEVDFHGIYMYMYLHAGMIYYKCDFKKRASPGIKPGTSRTLSKNHASRPTGHLVMTHCIFMCCILGLQATNVTYNAALVERSGVARFLAEVKTVA